MGWLIGRPARPPAPRPRDAVPAYQAAIGLLPHSQAAYVALSHALHGVGERAASRQALDKATARAGRRLDQDPWWGYPRASRSRPRRDSWPSASRRRDEGRRDDLEPRGVTALWDGLYAGLKLPVSRGRPVVVLFTDGQDNVSWLTRDQVHRVAEESEALVYVVAIAPPPEERPPAGMRGVLVEPRGTGASPLRALSRLAEATGGRLWPADSSAQLGRTFLRILAEMRSRYLLCYGPSGGPREGWHRLKVKVKGHRGTVRSRSGYFVAPPAGP